MRALLLQTLAPLAAHRGLSALERLRVLWPLLAGATLARASRPERIEQRRLVLVVGTPGLAQELQLASGEILARINQYRDVLETPRLATLVTRIAPHGTFPVAAPRPVRTPLAERDLAPGIESALDQVEDPTLRARLRRLAAHRTDPPGS